MDIVYCINDMNIFETVKVCNYTLLKLSFSKVEVKKLSKQLPYAFTMPTADIQYHLLSSHQLIVGSRVSPQTAGDTCNQCALFGETQPIDQSICAKRKKNMETKQGARETEAAGEKLRKRWQRGEGHLIGA